MGMDRRSFGGFYWVFHLLISLCLSRLWPLHIPKSPSPLFVHGLLGALQIKQCVHFVLPQQRT